MLRLVEEKLMKVLLFLVLFISMGVIGYMMIEDYGFVDALYMTIITLSTVGFGEVHQLSESGRIFTMFLILSGVGILAYAATIFAEEIIEGKLLQKYKSKKVEKKIKDLEEHVIICGFGRNGRQAARKLQLYNTPYVIVERDIEKVNNHEGLEKSIFVEGDATNDNTLIQAQIQDAKALVAALPSDADNLFIVLTARQLNPNLRIISRASSSNSIAKLKIAGADNVIMPDKIGGAHMASLIVTPDLVEFLDKISVDSSTHVNMVEVDVDDFPNEYLGKTIKQLNMRDETGCTIIGVKEEDGDYQINPEYATPLNKGMQFIILGKPQQIERLKNYYKLPF